MFSSGTTNDYDTFLKATNYIQKYTNDHFHVGNGKLGVTSPETILELNELLSTIKGYIDEQRELNKKVESFMDAQRSINTYVVERVEKCQCGIGSSDMVTRQLKLDEMKKKCGIALSPFDCPTTSTHLFNGFLPDPTDIKPHQIDVDILSMMDGNQVDDNVIEQKYSDTFDEATEDVEKKRPYTCQICGKSFRQRHGLAQHQITHTTQKVSGQFFCNVCGKKYTRQESVTRHKRTTNCSKFDSLSNVSRKRQTPNQSNNQQQINGFAMPCHLINTMNFN